MKGKTVTVIAGKSSRHQLNQMNDVRIKTLSALYIWPENITLQLHSYPKLHSSICTGKLHKPELRDIH